MAGEASGDLHGYRLMQEIKKKLPLISFRGVGGPKMASFGLKSLVPFERLAIMGFGEVLKNILFFLKIKKLILQDINSCQPSKIILIDYPGFNLSLAKSIKKQFNIPVLFYISPQVWAWKEQRVQTIKKYVDKLIVIFPFEVEWFQRRGIDVEYFGHPLVENSYNKTVSHKNITTVGLFPGSRKQEIDKHVPLFKRIIKKLLKYNSNLHFVICQAPGLSPDAAKSLQTIKGAKIMTESNRVFSISSVAIVASGTATLECAISKTPFVVVYKSSLINWLIVKYCLSIQSVSIVNILANHKIVSEFLQSRANPNLVSRAIIKLLENPGPLKKKLDKIHKQLGPGQAYKKTASYIVDF